MRERTYTASDIDHLEGLEPVRKRPGMYIGGTGADGLHHLLWEIVDNAVDEAIGGYATTIGVTLHADGATCTVEDNGRGIPVDEHPKARRPALEVIFTTLHSGAKFKQGAYATSGGLHGVGASVVNALSSRLEAHVRRDGREWALTFRQGRPQGDLRDVGEARGTGTKITFTPDASVFSEVTFDAERIRAQLEVKTFLHPGLRIVFKDEVGGTRHELKHDGGLRDYLAHLLVRGEARALVEPPFAFERDDDGMRLHVALTWSDAPREVLLSYVNGIPTRDGGTHEQGFREGFVKAIRGFMETHGLAPRNVALTAEDIREGVVAVVSLFLSEPQFQGQTKDRLNNPEARAGVDGLVRPLLEQWLHENRSQGEMIVHRAVQAARARLASRQAADSVRRKSATSRRLNLPGKLADCSKSEAEDCELFIVEGDSAGGSAKQGRDRTFQAILPIRGKVLNAEQARLDKVLQNEELSNIVTALGCGMGKDYREDRLRYERIILLMDADSDGHHITTLMLTFLYRYLTPLVQGGHVYIAQPPLFRITAGAETWWALDDAHRDRILAQLPARAKPEITRFKGLGEMPPKTLFETTLDPNTRRLLRVTLEQPMDAENVITDLMGKDTAPRFRFIMEQAGRVHDLDV